MSRRAVVVFDFDGTLVETMHSVMRIVNQLADEYGFEKVKEEDVEKLRGKGTKEVFKSLKIPLIKLPFVVKEIRAGLSQEIESLKMVAGIKPILVRLRSEGYSLGILTSNSKENVENFLSINSLDMFDFVYSSSSVFGKSKVMNSMLRDKDLEPEQVIYVGDETRDIEAAKKVGIKVIAVTWGFNSKEVLEECKPNYLVSRPRNIVDVLRKS